MALTPALLYEGQPGTTDGTLYTVSATAGSFVIVKEILINNVTGADATISLARNGTAATAGNCIYAYTLTIPANTLVPLGTFSTVLNASDTLHGLQGISGALVVTISGVTGP